MRYLGFDVVADSVAAAAADALPSWWSRIDADPAWRKYSEYGLAAGYGVIALVALIQLVRRCHYYSSSSNLVSSLAGNVEAWHMRLL